VTANSQQGIHDALGGLPDDVKRAAILAARRLNAAWADDLARADGPADRLTMDVPGRTEKETVMPVARRDIQPPDAAGIRPGADSSALLNARIALHRNLGG